MLIDLLDDRNNFFSSEVNEQYGVTRFQSPLPIGSSEAISFLLIRSSGGEDDQVGSGERTITTHPKELIDTDLGKIEAYPVTVNQTMRRFGLNTIVETTTYWVNPDIGIVGFRSVVDEVLVLGFFDRTTLNGRLSSVNFSVPPATPY